MWIDNKSLIIFILTVSLADAAAINRQQNKLIPQSGIIKKLIDKDNTLFFYPYESNYIIYTYTSNLNKAAIYAYNWANKARKAEIKFQLSLAFPLWQGIIGENSILAASYTQRSWWQAFNRSSSSPFRETSYSPQLFLGWSVDRLFAGWTLQDIEVGFSHESNGRPEPTSRSWNRIYGRLLAKKGNWLTEITPWYRLPEDRNTDDNPDITKYMGYYRIRLGYQWKESVLSLQGNYNWSTGYGGVLLGWSYPVNEHIRFYSQLFSGYGESLIDYNHHQTRFGVGVMYNDLF